MSMAKDEAELVGRYAACGRDAVNIVQMCAGLAQLEDRAVITREDVQWVVQSGHYAARPPQNAETASRVGMVHGLAVFGAHQGAVMEIEAVSVPGTGQVTVTGIVDEEELGEEGRRMRRRSTASASAENVRTLLRENGFDLGKRDLHINFPGGAPVDGPSAGVAMAVVAVSALTGQRVDGEAACTGEISVQGRVKAVGGVPAKVEAARRAGLKRVLIPQENAGEVLIEGIEVHAITTLQEAMSLMLLPPVEAAAVLENAEVSERETPLAAQPSGGENSAVANVSGACKRENLPL